MKVRTWFAVTSLPLLVACGGSSGGESGEGSTDSGHPDGTAVQDSGGAAEGSTGSDAGADASKVPEAGMDATKAPESGTDATTGEEGGGEASTSPEAGMDATMGPETGIASEGGAITDSGNEATTVVESGVDSSSGGGSDAGDAAAEASVDAGDGGLGFTLSFSAPTVVAAATERASQGFKFGYVDGVLGGINKGDAGYEFVVSAHSEPAAAGTCNGTPDTQGAYRIGLEPTSITTNFGCTAMIANSGDVVPDGSVLGAYDRDYVGGGPVFAVSNGSTVAHGLIYHSEFHWGPTCDGAPCFYGTLGLAFSTDGGITFTKYGEIIQPAISRPDWVTGHPATSLSVGAGPFVLGDVNGAPIDPTSAYAPASTYLYVLYDDYDTTNAAPCATSLCLTVARASMQDLADAAFGVVGAKPASQLFSKYYEGSTGNFGSAAASGSSDDSVAAGHETFVLPAAYEASALFDRPIDKFLLAYRNAGTTILIRSSSSVLSWPADELSTATIDEDAGVRYPSLLGELQSVEVGSTSPYIFYTNGLTTWPTSTFMLRQVIVTQ
jgi:hypothetical protein